MRTARAVPVNGKTYLEAFLAKFLVSVRHADSSCRSDRHLRLKTCSKPHELTAGSSKREAAR